MISNHDRSGYIGASDTKYVVGNWNTKTFEKWWLKKIGIDTSHFENKYTKAGTNFEHKIIESLGIENIEKDKQVIKGRLRINLDSNTEDCIYEVKTYQLEKGFDIKKHKDYIQQVLVQMYGTEIHKANIVAYGLEEREYDNYLIPIDKKRLEQIPIEYDKEWIETQYLPRFKYLEKCLINGEFPNKKKFEEEENGDNINNLYNTNSFSIDRKGKIE